MPFFILDRTSCRTFREEFRYLLQNYLDKEGYSVPHLPANVSAASSSFYAIPVMPFAGSCELERDEYIVFNGRSIFDLDLSLFIRTSRALKADMVVALNYSDHMDDMELFGVNDDFSVFGLNDPEGLWVDGYEDGGVYYLRKNIFTSFKDLNRVFGISSLRVTLEKLNTSFSVKALPMGGRCWFLDKNLSPLPCFEDLVSQRVPALFLDRDGVIVQDTGYVHGTDLNFIERISPLVFEANSKGDLVVVVTNQSGVARGYYSESDVEATHEFIRNYLSERGLRIDRFYYCPFHMEGSLDRYRRRSLCRKPDPGMVLKASSDMGLDLSRSLMIGDREKDMIKLPYLQFQIFR